MKNLLSALILFSSMQTLAAEIEVTTCEDRGISLNSIYSMKLYANKSVKVFEIDMEEPAAAPAGVAITINRGDDLATMETFCRFVPGFAQVDVLNLRSRYDAQRNAIILSMKAYKTNDEGISQLKTLTITINKGAKNEADLVKADLK